jgi:hypothetical protein
MLRYTCIAPFAVFICIYTLFNDAVTNPDHVVYAGWLVVDSKLCITWWESVLP